MESSSSFTRIYCALQKIALEVIEAALTERRRDSDGGQLKFIATNSGHLYDADFNTFCQRVNTRHVENLTNRIEVVIRKNGATGSWTMTMEFFTGRKDVATTAMKKGLVMRLNFVHDPLSGVTELIDWRFF